MKVCAPNIEQTSKHYEVEDNCNGKTDASSTGVKHSSMSPRNDGQVVLGGLKALKKAPDHGRAPPRHRIGPPVPSSGIHRGPLDPVGAILRARGTTRLGSAQALGGNRARNEQEDVSSGSQHDSGYHFRLVHTTSEATSSPSSGSEAEWWQQQSDLDETIVGSDDCLARRFQQKTADLFENYAHVLSAHRRVAFNQTEALREFVPDEADLNRGYCYGLSVAWLLSSHSQPDLSPEQRTRTLVDVDHIDQALNITRLYRKSGRELLTHRWHPAREAVENVGLDNVKVGKYRMAEVRRDEFTIGDVARVVVSAIQRSGAYHVVGMETGLSAHAVACAAKSDGSFSVFDANTGAYEASLDELPKLLASLLAAHETTIANHMQQGASHRADAAQDLGDVQQPSIKMAYVFPVQIRG